jgi:hypothetical protein
VRKETDSPLSKFDGVIFSVAANPLDKIEVLEHVSFVMKGGKVYKDEVGAEKL